MNIKEIEKHIEESRIKQKNIYHNFVAQHNALQKILPFKPEDIKGKEYPVDDFIFTARTVCEIPYGGNWTDRFVLEPANFSIGRGTIQVGYITDKHFQKVKKELEFDVVNVPEFSPCFKPEDGIENYYLKQCPCDGVGHKSKPKCDVPEPSTLVLLAIGVVILIWMRITRK